MTIPGEPWVFGPLPTRRLGWSLGIDTVPPKTCNWNCVYCQLGRTHPLTTERKTYAPPWKSWLLSAPGSPPWRPTWRARRRP